MELEFERPYKITIRAVDPFEHVREVLDINEVVNSKTFLDCEPGEVLCKVDSVEPLGRMMEIILTVERRKTWKKRTIDKLRGEVLEFQMHQQCDLQSKIDAYGGFQKIEPVTNFSIAMPLQPWDRRAGGKLLRKVRLRKKLLAYKKKVGLVATGYMMQRHVFDQHGNETTEFYGSVPLSSPKA